MGSKQTAMIAGITAAIIWGLSFIFTKQVLSYITPFELGGLRYLLAALSITLLWALRFIRLTIDREGIRDLLIIALFQPVIYFIAETYGVKFTTAAEAGVMISLIPIIVPVLSVFMLKEKVSLGQVLFTVLAIIGVIVIVAVGSGDGKAAGNNHALGIALLLLAVLSGSLYNIASRSASARYSPIDITFVMMWAGAIFFNGLAITEGTINGSPFGYFSNLGLTPVLLSTMYLGVISSLGAFFALNYALNKLPASQVAIFLNLIPLVTLLASVVFYHKILGTWQLIGSIAILIGVWGASIAQLKSISPVSKNSAAA
ncbi:MAG: DMT family transporter [Methylocystaceae bacterium]